MAFPASEGDVLIVNGLGPVFVMILKSDGSRERLGYVKLYAYVCIGGVLPLLGGF